MHSNTYIYIVFRIVFIILGRSEYFLPVREKKIRTTYLPTFNFFLFFLERRRREAFEAFEEAFGQWAAEHTSELSTLNTRRNDTFYGTSKCFATHCNWHESFQHRIKWNKLKKCFSPHTKIDTRFLTKNKEKKCFHHTTMDTREELSQKEQEITEASTSCMWIYEFCPGTLKKFSGVKLALYPVPSLLDILTLRRGKSQV